MISQKLKYLIVSLILIFIAAEASAQKKLSPSDFEKKMNSTMNYQLVDVRTPEEYNDKHLKNAFNIDYKNSQFETKIASLDKNKPTFVYCLAGSRSSAAVEIMKAQGFKEIYELDGGINQWIRQKKSVERSNASNSEGMDLQTLTELTKGNKLIIVDFNAEWCGPCKKMKPFLDKAAKEQSSKVSIVPVDADKSEELVQHFNIEALPTLLLFKNSKQLLRHEGFLDEAGLNDLIRKYQ